MNNTFDAKRFGRLLKKTLLERPMQTLGLTGLLLALSLILYSVIKAFGGFNPAQNITFIWGLAGGGCFLASFVFGYFSSNAMGSSFLTLPASNFEKWLCGVLIAGVFYPVIFLLFFRLVDSSFVAIYHHGLDSATPFYKQLYESVYIFDLNGFVAWKVYPMYGFLAGSMLVGALYFNKVAFIKTAIVFSMLFMVVIGINWIMATLLFGHVNNAGPFNSVTIPAGKEEGTIELPSGFVGIINNSVWYVLPPILWLLAFTRLREKEF
ncbi:MAG: hypothetical protein Q8891_08580 [Bacteroidota bacterium]|nr:hypothetical protein [Bacteroidota bacterium]